MRTQIANIITGSRILCSAGMLFCPVDSVCFYVLYLFCGLSDMVDGTVARKTGAVSKFGAGLDTAADFAFMAAACIKLLPSVKLPAWIWIWAAVIAVIKCVNMANGIIVGTKMILPHTVANRITGFFLFLLPFTMQVVDLNYSVAAVCAMATFSAIQEGHCTGSGGGENHDP